MKKEIELLTEIQSILKEQDFNNSSKRETGQNFNLLKIIGAESSELSHSKIIGDLLNPNSTSKHGQGDTFLRIFLKQINLDNWIIEDEPIKLKGEIIERSIGKIDSAFEKGGRIDIVIEFKDKLIMIENKIYANDEKKQLLRYFNYGSKKKDITDFRLLYLTPDGKKAKEYSSSNLKPKTDYFPISYDNHIFTWLQECLKVCDSRLELQFGMLRNGIVQYQEILMLNKTWRQISELVFTSDIGVISNICNKHIVKSDRLENAFEYVSDPNFINHIKAKIQQLFWRDLEAALFKKDILTNVEYNEQGHDTLIWKYYKENVKNKNKKYGIELVDSKIRIALNGNGCVLKYLPNTKPMYLKINTSENSKIDINFNLFNESLVKEMVDEDRRKVLIHRIVEGIISDIV